MTIDTNKQYFATIKMDIGDVRIQLFAADAPQTVNSFVFLARDSFFDGVTFHRVLPGFVAQAGDPTGTGRGGPGYTVPFESNSHTHTQGAVAMAATAARGPYGSQFFIDLVQNDRLNGDYAVFGQVVAGMDVVDKIAPREPSTAKEPGTRINTITIEEQ
jgi:cyclophilin family peptidyl-prolyl cis-trans isomerase